jgi:hypothetical protein
MEPITIRPGDYAVTLRGFQPSRKSFTELEPDEAAAEMLQRLGYTKPLALAAVRRAHVEPEVILNGVSLDTAVAVKKALEHYRCRASIKRTGHSRDNGRSGHRQPIPEKVRSEVWRRDGGKCVDCGSRERLEFDHIIPVSKGGSNTVRNLEIRCESCNRAKGADV